MIKHKNIANSTILIFKKPLISFVNAISFSLKNKKGFFFIKNNPFLLKQVQLLVDERLLASYSLIDDNIIKVILKKDEQFNLHLKSIKLLSKPSRLIYLSVSQIKLYKKLSINNILILSTNKGILTDKKALELNVGGLLLYSLK